MTQEGWNSMKAEKTKRERHMKAADLVQAENEYHQALGAKIKELREQAGLNQTDLANALKVHQSFIALLEKGKVKSMYRIRQAFETMGYDLEIAQKKHSAT